MEWLNEYLPELIALVVSVISAASAFVVCWFKNRKSKLDLETAKTEYQAALLNGAYVLCPKCGEKIYAKDCVWKFEAVKIDSNSEEVTK